MIELKQLHEPHRVVVWSAPDEITGTSRVAYCDEPGCPGRGKEIAEGVCYPVGARPRIKHGR